METVTKAEIAANLFLSFACGIIAALLWGFLVDKVLSNLFGIQWGWTPGMLLALGINLFHFLFGWFHADDDVSGLGLGSLGKSARTRRVYNQDRVQIMLYAVVTIGLSRYLVAALSAWERGQKQDT
jgi:hypothetical protein